MNTMPTLFIIFGLRFFFYSNEHLAIHVHAEKGDGEAKIELDSDIKLIYNKGLKQSDLKKAMKIAKIYQDDLIAEWHKYFG